MDVPTRRKRPLQYLRPERKCLGMANKLSRWRFWCLSLRGGSWDYDLGDARIALKDHADPYGRYGSIGFRVVFIPSDWIGCVSFQLKQPSRRFWETSNLGWINLRDVLLSTQKKRTYLRQSGLVIFWTRNTRNTRKKHWENVKNIKFPCFSVFIRVLKAFGFLSRVRSFNLIPKKVLLIRTWRVP